MLRILRLISVILFLMPAVFSCEEAVVNKPKKLVPKNVMINMLTDIHMAEAIFQTKRMSSEELRKFTDADFYHSVLKKYNVADTTFEQSLVYYASLPTEYEKIYVRVIGKLNELEQQISIRQQQPADITPK
jgi:hypothetical protein